MEGYYLKNASADPDDIFANPTEHCHVCPPHANCSAFNTTLESLGVPSGFWRASLLTAQLYGCDDSDTCSGSGGTSRALEPHRQPSNGSADATGRYCANGHAGPLCGLCVDDNHYFSDDKRRCVACPSSSYRFGILSAVILGAAMLCAAMYLVTLRSSKTHRFLVLCFDTGFQAKCKILVSFYQVCAVLRTIYGVRLDDDFAGQPRETSPLLKPI